MTEMKEVKIIGMSILGVPNAFCTLTGTSDIAFNRIFATAYLKENNLVAKDIWHHYLGLGDPRELVMQDLLGVADSNDSSSAIWHGILGISYDSSAGGLLKGKNTTEVNFNLEYTDKNLAAIKYNTKRLRDWAGHE